MYQTSIIWPSFTLTSTLRVKYVNELNVIFRLIQKTVLSETHLTASSWMRGSKFNKRMYLNVLVFVTSQKLFPPIMDCMGWAVTNTLCQLYCIKLLTQSGPLKAFYNVRFHKSTHILVRSTMDNMDRTCIGLPLVADLWVKANTRIRYPVL